MQKETILNQLDELVASVLLLDRVRRVRTKRGARARRGLMTVTRELESTLYQSYEKCRKDIIACLRGRSDDLATGRLAQEVVDRDRLAQAIYLLLYWRSRQRGLAIRAISSLFRAGKRVAFRELKITHAPGSAPADALIREVHSLYEGDLERLRTALEMGSPRATGVREIFLAAASVSDATDQINTLFKAERFRLDLFAESLIWTAFLQGYRAGAVDGAQLAISNGEEPAQYRWVGPADSLTCAPCLSQFGHTIQARTLGDLPLPQSICAYGRNCRHHFSRAG